MARTIPYRDLNGYIIEPKYKPIFDESREKLSGGYSVAVLTYCPEIDGLKHIGECEKCEFFRGHAQYEGVMCASEAPDKTPLYMKQTNPKRTYQYGNNKNKTPNYQGAIRSKNDARNR